MIIGLISNTNSLIVHPIERVSYQTDSLKEGFLNTLEEKFDIFTETDFDVDLSIPHHTHNGDYPSKQSSSGKLQIERFSSWNETSK